MAQTALITGASSGLGTEFAKIAANDGYNLVLVARGKVKLEKLKTELESKHKVSVMVIPQDLSVAGSAQQVFQATEQAGVKVDVLINNAGFGGHGKFHERELTQDEAMMQLNMATLTSLTHLYLQGMVKRNRGKILNVASTAGFLPGPLQAVYYATKSYVNSFSWAIAEELSDTKVTVTALCPGPVDTGFVAAGNLDGVEAFKTAANAHTVASVGYKAMQKGKLVAFDKASLSFMLQWLIPLFPRKMVLKMSRQAMEKS